jgi:hypothetical protein
MTSRNDWQAFYRQQVQEMGDLIHLPSVLPPRFKPEVKAEEEITNLRPRDCSNSNQRREPGKISNRKSFNKG